MTEIRIGLLNPQITEPSDCRPTIVQRYHLQCSAYYCLKIMLRLSVNWVPDSQVANCCLAHNIIFAKSAAYQPKPISSVCHVKLNGPPMPMQVPMTLWHF